MQKAKLLIAAAGLFAGFILASAIHRPRPDLNMDGAPPVSVPGYTGPIYDAKRKLVGYAQPQIVNLMAPLPVMANATNKPERHPTPVKLSVKRPIIGPQPIALKPLTLR